MNVLTIFDQRIGAIFEEGAPGARLPFSFKRLAKRAVREMEDETFVIDGVDTAPALYTILVSEQSDSLMHPMYPRITDEISQLIEAQAKKRGYTFVGRPLVRFMVDPALHGGRFSVFAENIDPRTLARLRDEENAYLGLTPMQDIYASQGFMPSPIPVHEEEPMPISQEVAYTAPVEDDFLDSMIFGDDDQSVSSPASPEVDAWAGQGAPADVEEPGPDPFEVIPDSYMTDVAMEMEDAVQPEPEPKAPFGGAHVDPQQAQSPAPQTPVSQPPVPQAPVPQMPVPQQSVPQQPEVAPQRVVTPQQPTVQVHRAGIQCTLLDWATGRSYRIVNTPTTIGRERMRGAVVLGDPNASRRHAELVYDGASWNVRDLNSTNGTLVNDQDVSEAPLKSGDVITIGLTNLEFRAG